MFFVYIIYWSNWKYYVWYTWNIERRLKEHSRWNTKSTKSMWEKILLWYFQINNKTEAIILEKQIKRSWHISRYLENVDFIKNIVGY